MKKKQEKKKKAKQEEPISVAVSNVCAVSPTMASLTLHLSAEPRAGECSQLPCLP